MSFKEEKLLFNYNIVTLKNSVCLPDLKDLTNCRAMTDKGALLVRLLGVSQMLVLNRSIEPTKQSLRSKQVDAWT